MSEAARMLGITPQMVRRLCNENKITSRKADKSWLVDELSVKKICLKLNLCDKDASSMTRKKGPTLLSFFSGAMGLDIGLERSGFNTLLASEIDKASRGTIISNKPDVALLGDIRNYTKKDVLDAAGLTEDQEIDLIAGGPPCQAFSTAGRRLGLEDDRGNVFLKYLDIAFELRPKYIVIENVRGLLSAPLKHRPHDKRGEMFPPLSLEEKPGGVLHYLIRNIQDSGYSFSFNLYNSANFGVSQTRERVVIICSRDGSRVPFLEPTHTERGALGLPKWISLREVLVNMKEEHEHVNFPEKRLKYYKLLSPGQYWKHLPKELQKEALGKAYYSSGGKTGFLRRVAWDKPCPTLVTHPAMPATDLAHPEEDRPLSIQEYKRIQQFPDHWKLEGRITDKYRQLGNAVPVGLGEAVGKAIIRHMNGLTEEKYQNFNYSRYKNTSDIDFREKEKAVNKNLNLLLV